MVSSGQRGFLLRLFRTLVGSTCSSNKDLQRGWGSSSLSPSGSPASEALQGSALNVSSAGACACLINMHRVGWGSGDEGLEGRAARVRSGQVWRGSVWAPARCRHLVVLSPQPATPEELDTPSPSCRKSPLPLWVALFSYAAKLRTGCLSAESELQNGLPQSSCCPLSMGCSETQFRTVSILGAGGARS